jgi:hypothetical protein
MADERTPHPGYQDALRTWREKGKNLSMFYTNLSHAMDEPCVFCLHPRLMSIGRRGCDNFDLEKQDRCGCDCRGGKPECYTPQTIPSALAPGAKGRDNGGWET